jgi:hypothetical protein
VITSFPQRWDLRASYDGDNMTSVARAVERRIDTKEWQVDDGDCLAELIANECSGILFDISKYREESLQVRDIFENVIGDVVWFIFSPARLE